MGNDKSEENCNGNSNSCTDTDRFDNPLPWSKASSKVLSGSNRWGTAGKYRPFGRVGDKRDEAVDLCPEQIPNIELFVSMYVRKEALLSSQIEGIQAALDDLLDPRLEENTNRNVAEVIHYINASQFAVKRLDMLSLCNSLIKESHQILMEDVRGVIDVFSYLEKSPIIEIMKTSKDLGLSYNATANAVMILIDLAILKQTENVKRNRVFTCEGYLKILRKDT